MAENGPTKMVSTAIEILSISISPCLIIVLHFLGSNAPCLPVLTEWSLPNPPLAIMYKLAGQAHSNYKLKYLSVYGSNLLLNICYWENASSWENFLLSGWWMPVGNIVTFHRVL
jgi:hypothetical protein